MIHDTLNKIEQKIRSSQSLHQEKKSELMELVTSLKKEVEELSRTHGDHAESIAEFTQVSAQEATRGEKNPHTLEHALEGLKSSVAGFEESHPRLVQVVNRICTTLSNLGI